VNSVCKTTLVDDKPNDETKPTGRRAARKNYKLDKDSDESDSDDDASEAETIVSSKKRKRTSTSEYDLFT
jgi:hypothetical protein